MKKTIVIAMLALVATPVFSQNQVKPITTLANTRQPRSKIMLSLSTAFGDTVLAQVADGGGWQTTITVLNLRSTPTTFSVICYGDNGSPQAFSWAGVGVYSSLYGSLAGSGSLVFRTVGTSSATSQGWCDVESPGSGPNPSTEPKNDVAAFAIFAYAPTGQQVSVPGSHWFVSNTNGSLTLAYDNTNGYSYGVALVDSDTITYVGQPSDTVNVYVMDQSGTQVATDSFQMAPASHLTFVLAHRYPIVANTQGTITFAISTSSGVRTLAGLGLRAAPWGALTSVDMFEPMTY
jgi:hypothetical protein